MPRSSTIQPTYTAYHLNSTVMETGSAGTMTADQKYFAGVYPRKGQAARYWRSDDGSSVHWTKAGWQRINDYERPRVT